MVRARLIAVVSGLVGSAEAYGPSIVGLPGRRFLTQRTDGELIVVPLDDSFRVQVEAAIRFPAPWPRRRGSWALVPDAGTVVFAGVHAVRAVDTSGAVCWEMRHGCWQDSCREIHQSYDEYADRPDHRYPKGGSAGFSADGSIVWAHVRSAVPDKELGENNSGEEWLVLNAGDGRVLARADARAVSEGSDHLPHPADPAQMGLSIGEGQDGAPVRWGRWDGERLTVEYIEDDVSLLDSSPSGGRLLSVSHDQATLTVRPTYGDPESNRFDLDCAAVVPLHPDVEADSDEAAVYWDWAGGFIDEGTVIGSTIESDGWSAEGRHWLIDSSGSHPVTQVVYPSPVSGMPVALGDGAWYTGESGKLHVWALETEV